MLKLGSLMKLGALTKLGLRSRNWGSKHPFKSILFYGLKIGSNLEDCFCIDSYEFELHISILS